MRPSVSSFVMRFNLQIPEIQHEPSAAKITAKKGPAGSDALSHFHIYTAGCLVYWLSLVRQIPQRLCFFSVSS